MTEAFKVVVTFEAREDGGIRAHSDEVPGLVLSSKDIDGLISDVPAVLMACLTHTLGAPVRVQPLVGLSEVLSPTPSTSRGVPGQREFVASVC